MAMLDCKDGENLEDVARRCGYQEEQCLQQAQPSTAFMLSHFCSVLLYFFLGVLKAFFVKLFFFFERSNVERG